MFPKILVFMLLLLATATASAKIFKWVDKNGETHYSEKAPAEQSALEVATPAAPPVSSMENSNQSSKIRQELESEVKADKAKREAQEQARAQQEAEARKTYCTDAQARQELYSRQIRIYSTDANNERVYLEDDARAVKLKKATDDIARYCNSR